MFHLDQAFASMSLQLVCSDVISLNTYNQPNFEYIASPSVNLSTYLLENFIFFNDLLMDLLALWRKR